MPFSLSNCLVHLVNEFVRYDSHIDKISSGFFPIGLNLRRLDADYICPSIRNGYTDLVEHLIKRSEIIIGTDNIWRILLEAIKTNLSSYISVSKCFNKHGIHYDHGVLLNIPIKNGNLEMVRYMIVDQKVPISRGHYLEAKCCDYPTIFEFIKSEIREV